MNEAFSNGVIRFRWWIIVGALLLVAAAGSGTRLLEYSNNYRLFFSEENPQLQAFEALQNTYTKNDNVLFAVAPRDRRVFTRETLAAVEWLTREAWRLPYVSRVDSIVNFQNAEGRGDELVVRDLVSVAATLSDAEVERVRRIALSEPMLVNRLIPPQAAVTGVNATFILPEKSLNEAPEIAAAARKLADRVRARYPHVEVYLTGSVMIDNAFGEHALKDMMTLTPIMYGVVLLVTALLLRSVSGTFAALVIVAFSTVTAMGLTGWLGIKLTPPSSAAPTVILTLAIAHSIHLLVTIFHAMRHGRDKHSAIRDSLRMNFYPMTLATVTDIVGFLSMNASEVPPFRDLGNIVTLGVIAAYAFSLLLLPALMAVLPLRVRPAKTRGAAVMDSFAEFIIRRRTPILVGMSLLTVSLIAMVPRNELNDNFVKYFDEQVEFRRHTDFIGAHLAGMDQIAYSLGAGESGGIANPGYLKKLDEFAAWYRVQPGVVHVSALADTLKRLNKNMHGDDPAQYRLPETRPLAAQYLLLYELSLPFGLDLNDQINVDKSATRFTVTMKSSTSKEIIALEERAQQWMQQHLPTPMQAHGTSPSVMFAHIGQRNIRSMIDGNLVALLLISAIMVFALRDIRLGLISLVPNLVPVGMAFGVWGLAVGQVGLALSVVAVMTYGIVVDDTIHSMVKYRQARRELGMSAPEAVRYVFATAGMAAWVMTLILVAGFLVLSVSDFELNSSMGIMTALTIALALLADYCLLPPLLMLLDRKTYAQTAAPRPVVPDPD